MILTIWGKSWAWKWTICSILAEKLWYEVICVWDIKRKLAEKMWLSIFEFGALGDLPWNEKEFDLKYEQFQQDLDVNDNIILDGRMAFYNQPKWFNVFVDVDPRESWRRIFAANRSTDKYESEEATIEATIARDAVQQKRYMKLYNVDLYDMSNYDLVIDTSELTPEQASKIILDTFITFRDNA